MKKTIRMEKNSLFPEKKRIRRVLLNEERRVVQMSKLIYSCLYYFSLAYLLIAGVVYVITLLAIFLDRKKRFFNNITELSPHRSVQIFTGLISPLILALGWIFLFPFTSGDEK